MTTARMMMIAPLTRRVEVIHSGHLSTPPSCCFCYPAEGLDSASAAEWTSGQRAAFAVREKRGFTDGERVFTIRTRTTLVTGLPFVRLSGKRVRIACPLLQRFYSCMEKERGNGRAAGRDRGTGRGKKPGEKICPLMYPSLQSLRRREKRHETRGTGMRLRNSLPCTRRPTDCPLRLMCDSPAPDDVCIDRSHTHTLFHAWHALWLGKECMAHTREQVGRSNCRDSCSSQKADHIDKTEPEGRFWDREREREREREKSRRKGE